MFFAQNHHSFLAQVLSLADNAERHLFRSTRRSIMAPHWSKLYLPFVLAQRQRASALLGLLLVIIRSIAHILALRSLP
jgi:hypothetical protein